VTRFTSFICYIDNHQYNKDSSAEATFSHSKGLLWPCFGRCTDHEASRRFGRWVCGALWPHSPQVV